MQVCRRKCTHIHTHTHTHKHARAHAHVHAHAHVQNAYTHNTHTHASARTFAGTHSRIRTHPRTHGNRQPDVPRGNCDTKRNQQWPHPPVILNSDRPRPVAARENRSEHPRSVHIDIGCRCGVDRDRRREGGRLGLACTRCLPPKRRPKASCADLEFSHRTRKRAASLGALRSSTRHTNPFCKSKLGSVMKTSAGQYGIAAGEGACQAHLSSGQMKGMGQSACTAVGRGCH
jgi:hypothetical protein